LVVFVDDSGSMNEGTKWADCAAIVTQVIELTTLFDSDGIQLEFMNSDVSHQGLASAEMCQSLFESIRPAGYTPLSYSCERKIIDPFFQKCSQCSKADVKPMIIYIITGAAPPSPPPPSFLFHSRHRRRRADHGPRPRDVCTNICYGRCPPSPSSYRHAHHPLRLRFLHALGVVLYSASHQTNIPKFTVAAQAHR
jgi:hypothetical protein